MADYRRRKYGPAAFVFELVEQVSDKSQLIEREQFYLGALDPYYNVAKRAGSNYGVRWSEEVKAKMSKANREVWDRPGHRQRMSDAHLGQRPSEEAKAKASMKLRGRKLSPEHRARVAERLSLINRSPERRAQTSARCKGRLLSQEVKDKISAAKKGRLPSDEHREKVSDGLRRAYAEGRRSRERPAEMRAAIAKSLAKVSAAQVVEIRTLRAQNATYREISVRFGISESSAYNICSGKTYGWVK